MGHESGVSQNYRQNELFLTTHASTLSGATTAIGTAGITALTLGESTDAAADVVAEDAFVAGIGHGCFGLGVEGGWG